MTSAFVIAVNLPQIKSWQQGSVDKLLASAKQDPEHSLALTQQASTVGFDDPVATEALAQQYRQIGESDKVLQVYQNSLTPTNPVYLGSLALQLNNPQAAKSFFQQANKGDESSQATSGLSLAAFASGDTTEGCTLAERANKLDLGNKTAQATLQICDILGDKYKGSQRSAAYILLNNYIYVEGQKRLEAIKDKSASDFLLLARIFASRGDMGKAIETLKAGLAVEPSNKDLLQTIVQYLQKDHQQTGDYQTRLQDVLFIKSN